MRLSDAHYLVLTSLPPPVAPVPGTPVSGEPTVPGPPDVLVLGALSALPEAESELAPELAPEVALPAPGMVPTPGDPDVAVPGEPVALDRGWAVEDLLDDDEPASPDAAPCAWACKPTPSAAAATRIWAIREENSGFIVRSDREVIRARLIAC